MEKIYIFTPYESLSLVLSNLLDIVGYLPITIENYKKLSARQKLNNESIFTNYSCLQTDKKFLNRFKNVIVFIPHEVCCINKEATVNNYTNKLIFFSQTLNIKNIQTLLNNIKTIK